MPYCLACGKLRETHGGFCRQCAADMSIRKKGEAQTDKARIMRNLAKEKMEPCRKSEGC